MNGPIPNITPEQLEELHEARVQGAIAVFAEKPEDMLMLGRAGDVLVEELARVKARTLTKKQAENALYALCHGCIDPSTKAVLEQLAGVDERRKKK